VRWEEIDLRKGGQASVQADLDRMTQTATRIRNAEVAIVPGLLQTAGYVRAIAAQSALIHGNTDVDAAVAARMRRQELLYDSAKQFEFVMTEAALRMLSCPRNVMLGQLDRLLSMDLENVTLGIIPMGRELQMTLYNGFLMLDDVLVTESYGYEDQGSDQAEAHARIFELLLEESATGEDARRLIVAAAASLRQELGNGVTRMYEQPQPNYTTQPHYAAPLHVVGDRKQVDWRLIGAYIIAAFGLGAALVCLWLLSSFKQVYASQMTQVNHAVTSDRTAQTKNASTINNLSGRVSTAEAQMVLLTPYDLVCSQYLTGPNGGPSTFTFPCRLKSGS
jgi:uncharacterized protein DUF5753